jgi:Holliday junction resolvase
VSAYQRGYAAELRAKRILERGGWVVCRAAGSHGLIDIVAWRADGILLVQVKRGTGRLSRTERTNLKRMPRPPNACVVCWRFVGRDKPLIEVL